ncbi:MAG: polyprenol monophosphomannose synthase [Anaerolineales bacterium]|nr:MAG: polyprenol monophosphomannose synthase [Anaerolineales bacterium]
MPGTLVVIPTYNEVENIAEISKALFDLKIDDLEILDVDDDSPDGTGQLADRLVTEYPERFHVMHRKGKLGLGTAYIQGFQWALQQGYRYVLHMDADFSHPPEFVPQMLASIPDYDVVVGSRYTKGGRLDVSWPWYRRLLSWWANSVWVRLILHTRTKDSTAGFKCWKAEALQRIGLERIRSTGYIFQVEMCYLAEKLGMRIKEIPIYFEERRQGESKMDANVKIEAALRVIELRSHYRHLKPENGYVHQ